MNRLSPYSLGIVFALVTALGLGSITTQAKIVYASGGNAVTLMLIRFLISTLVFGLVLLIRKDRFVVARNHRLALALLGLAMSGAMMCYLISVETISVSLAVLILYTFPLLILAYSIFCRQIKASFALLALFAGAFFGIYLALSGGSFLFNPIGVLLAGLASLGVAYAYIWAVKVVTGVTPLQMSFWISCIGLVLVLPFAVNNLSFPETSGGMLALASVTAIYVLAILCQFQALARLSAATTAFVLNLEPVVSILLASVVLNEILSPTQWFGVTLVLAAILLSLRYKTNKVLET